MPLPYSHLIDSREQRTGIFTPTEQGDVSQLAIAESPAAFVPPLAHQVLVQERLAVYEQHPEQALDFDAALQAIEQTC